MTLLFIRFTMNKCSVCFTFDLDDTLYRERDYQLSGFRAVSDYCHSVYGINLIDKILDWDMRGNVDIFGSICTDLGIPHHCKESLLWVYRNHFPSISLANGVAETVREIAGFEHIVAILTDGRSVTQRQKINALGLSGLPVFISEEWNENKPGVNRFLAIQSLFPAEEYWYIGDNPKKDFLAPNKLGWKTLGVIGDHSNIHSQCTKKLPVSYHPNSWASSLDEAFEILLR